MRFHALLAVLGVVLAALAPLGRTGDSVEWSQAVRGIAPGPSKPGAKLPARTFNSQFDFSVWAMVDEANFRRDLDLGRTPAATPIKVPECTVWGVEPGSWLDADAIRKRWERAGVNVRVEVPEEHTLAGCLRELADKGIPGLRLPEAASDDCLARLKGLASLRCLLIWSNRYKGPTGEVREADGTVHYPMTNRITEAGLVCLRGFKGLDILELGGNNFTDSALVYVKGLTGLKMLILDEPFTDAGLVHLKNLYGLKTLNLSWAKVTGTGLVHLRNLRALETLMLSHGSQTDADVVNLKELKGLRNLNLACPGVTDAALVHVGDLKGLRALYLGGTKVSDEGLVHLKELKELSVLDLSHTQVTGAGLAHLEELSGMRLLVLSGVKISDEALAHLKGLQNLQALNLWRSGVTDAGLVHLKALKGLKTLCVRVSDGVTARGVEDLRKVLPQLQIAVEFE